MKLAQVWYDDPDGQYEKVCNELMEAFRKGIISRSECGAGRGVAAECRDRAKKVNRERKEKGKRNA